MTPQQWEHVRAQFIFLLTALIAALICAAYVRVLKQEIATLKSDNREIVKVIMQYDDDLRQCKSKLAR